MESAQDSPGGASGAATVVVRLAAEEKILLWQGLAQWLGPARPTEELARAMGFSSVAHLSEEAARLARVIHTSADNIALTPLDWTRALVATEINFASDVFGAGYQWASRSGMRDSETLPVLRGLQHKLVSIWVTVKGTELGTLPPSSEP